MLQALCCDDRLADLSSDVHGLAVSLLPFQRKGVQFMIDRESEGGGGILADEMGLGKTVELVALMLSRPATATFLEASDALRPCRATLVVVPESLVHQWQREFTNLAPSLNVVRFLGTKKQSARSGIEALAAADVVLCSYEVLGAEHSRVSNSDKPARSLRGGRQGDTAPSALRLLRFWRVVLDEVQFAQDGRKHGQVVRLVATANRWAVSGTPTSARKAVEDLGQLVDFVRGPEWKAERSWKLLVGGLSVADEAADPTSAGVEQTEVARPEAARPAEARQAEAVKAEAALIELVKPFFLRRTKAQVASELHMPPQSVVQRVVELSPAERALQAHFVLPAATREVETGSGEPALLTHTRLSLLCPRLHAAWGRKSKEHIARARGAKQGGSGSTAAAARLVGSMSVHKEGAELWDSLHAAATTDRNAELRSIHMTVADGLDCLTHGDVQKLQTLACINAIGHLGHASRSRQHLSQHLSRKRRLLAATAVAVDGLEASTVDEAKGICYIAMGLVFDYLSRVYEAEWKEAEEKSARNGFDPDSLFTMRRRFLLHTFPISEAAGVYRASCAAAPALARTPPVRAADQPCSLGEEMRWADVAPLLAIDPSCVDPDARPNEDGQAQLPSLWGPEDWEAWNSGGAAGVSAARRNRITVRWFNALTLLSHPRVESHSHLPLSLALALTDVGKETEAMCAKAEQLLLPIGGWQRSRFIATGPHVPVHPFLPHGLGNGIHQITERQLELILSCPAETADVRTSCLGQHEHRLAHVMWKASDALSLPMLQQRLRDAGSAARARLEGSRGTRDTTARLARGRGHQRVNALRVIYDSIEAGRAAWRGTPSFELSRSPAAVSRTTSLGESAKLDSLIELIEGGGGIPHDEKLVVFSCFPEALPLLSKLLSARGVKSVSLGLASQRAAAQAAFQSDPSVRVFLLHAAAAAGGTGAGAAGLNLTAASHVVFLDVLTDPELEQQSIGRISRIGQSKPMKVWHLLAKDSVDQPLRARMDQHTTGASGSSDAAAGTTTATEGDESGLRAAIAEATHLAEVARCADTARRAQPCMVGTPAGRSHPNPCTLAAASSSSSAAAAAASSPWTHPGRRLDLAADDDELDGLLDDLLEFDADFAAEAYEYSSGLAAAAAGLVMASGGGADAADPIDLVSDSDADGDDGMWM